MKLEHFHNLTDLTAVGINILTGESDKLCVRLLCDVTEEGKVALYRALGVSDITLPAAWNNGVGSILLTRDMLFTVALTYMVEHAEQDSEIWQCKDGTLLYIEHDGLCNLEYTPEVLTSMGVIRRYPSGSTRHQHQMSGRIE